jgi:hypothetical protein
MIRNVPLSICVATPAKIELVTHEGSDIRPVKTANPTLEITAATESATTAKYPESSHVLQIRSAEE